MAETTGQKQIRTRARLVSTARRLTAERGLHGFTIPEVCDEVGVSRRTFFNYFPSKESAVLGLENGLDEGLLAVFLEARSVAPDKRRDLFDDLIDLAVGHFEAMNPKASDIDVFVAVLQREPKLIAAAVQTSRDEQERFVARVVESQGDQDPTAVQVAIVTFDALLRLSVEACLRAGNLLSFASILRARVDSARLLFSSAPTRNLVTTT
jgi:AcrR family transcriptional regulator